MLMTKYVEGPFQSEQTATKLWAARGCSSVLAAIGLYGVVAYAMAQRTKELGVRIALGAQPVDVVRLVASQASGVLTAGLIVGLVAALAISRILSSMLYLVRAGDVAVFGGAAIVMIVIAVVATSLPARRATSVDPLTALRAE